MVVNAAATVISEDGDQRERQRGEGFVGGERVADQTRELQINRDGRRVERLAERQHARAAPAIGGGNGGRNHGR